MTSRIVPPDPHRDDSDADRRRDVAARLVAAARLIETGNIEIGNAVLVVAGALARIERLADDVHASGGAR